LEVKSNIPKKKGGEGRVTPHRKKPEDRKSREFYRCVGRISGTTKSTFFFVTEKVACRCWGTEKKKNKKRRWYTM